MNSPIYSCMTKAMVAEGDQTMPSAKWATSRRASLKVFGDRLECGDWEIPHADVIEATLHSGAGLLFPGYVLRVKTKDQTYQFGLNPMPYWKGELPFPVRRVERSAGQTRFVFAVRGFVLAGIGYWIWTQSGA